MDARVRRVEKFVLVELSGRVDDFHTDIVKEELETIYSTGRHHIAIQLTDVTALSARVVNAWLDVYEKTLRSGGGLVLVDPRGPVLELVESLGLGSVLPIVPSIQGLKSVSFPEFSQGSQGGLGLPLGRLLRRLLGSAAGVVFLACLWPLPRAVAQEPTSMTLDEAQRLARERSPYVRLSRAKFQEKDADFEIARRGPMPKFTGTMGYLYQSNPNVLTSLVNREANAVRSGAQESELSEIQTRNQFRIDKNAAVIGVGALQVLYAGGYFDARSDLARLERQQGQIEVRLSEYELVGLVRDLFLGILLLEEKQRLLEARELGNAARLDALQQAVASRAVGEMQVHEVEIEVLKARRELRESQGELATRRNQFNALLGRPETTPVKLRLPNEETLENAPSAEPFQAALARNPIVAKGLGRIATAESYLRLVRSQEMFVPKAFAFGGVDHTRGLGSDVRFVNWSLGVGLVVPLFDGGVQAEETRKALALRSQAESGYEIEVAKLKQDTSDATLKLELAREGYALANRALALAKRGLDEAASATAAAQLPRFRLEEIKVKKIEAELALVAARAEVLRWQSVLSSLSGEES
jgi:anti-anti-sigma factor